MTCTAESCTGGLIAKTFTDLAGSSDWFDRGFVTYSNAAKSDMLAVPASIIDDYGAVSEPVAVAMAGGALRHSQADYAVAVTGVAGPGGGSDDKPVGTVWIAVASADARRPCAFSSTATARRCARRPRSRRSRLDSTSGRSGCPGLATPSNLLVAAFSTRHRWVFRLACCEIGSSRMPVRWLTLDRDGRVAARPSRSARRRCSGGCRDAPRRAHVMRAVGGFDPTCIAVDDADGGGLVGWIWQ